MKKWDYSELTKEAKKHGGPEQYLAEYGEEKFNEGRLIGEEEGEKKGEIKGVVEGSALTVIIGGVILCFMKLRERRAKKIAEKVAQSCKKSTESAQKYFDATEEIDEQFESNHDETEDF
ncbi:MAG: hypothetical protein J6I46_01180 [Ruminococcus sp.]|nr:hypothetical protein [Ruminococcus sp.]MBP3796372.1 hypothetical protein [Ruminococcus sp.]